MTQAYRIVDWKRRYEVTSKGRAADEKTPLEELRKSPLDYIRSRVYGHSIGPALHNLIDKAYVPGEINEFAVFGLFHKLLELAGNQNREFRGWILDKDQQPMGSAQICKLFRIQEREKVQQALNVLCHPEIGWLEVVKFPGSSGNSRILPESSGLFIKETETEDKVSLNERVRENLDSSASDATRDFSGSVSEQTERLAIAEARSNAVKRVCWLLKINPENQSDVTTLQHIFEQIEERVVTGELTVKIFDAVVDEAKDAASHRFKKIARFVNAMKAKRFGYVPVRKEIFGSVYRKQ